MEELIVDAQKDGDEIKGCSPGRKLSHAVGMSRWTAQTGTPMLSMGFVVLRDGAKKGDEGQVFIERFAMTSKAIFRIARWANASGHQGAFNALDDDAVQKIMARGPVVAVLEEDTYNGKTRTQVESFAPYSGQVDPAWEQAIAAGEQEWARIQQRIADKQQGGGASASASASGGGSYGGGGGAPTPPTSAYDDIPF